jgi:methylated-DNA-[protein]-cysteine S-methyltransferase
MVIPTSFGSLSIKLKNEAIISASLSHDRPVEDTAPRTAFEKKLYQDLTRYFAGHTVSLNDYPVDLSALPAFSRQVLEAARRIPYGGCLSYGELAHSLGRPKAARAVGQALARNPVAVLIPCHRVIGHQGDLHGFAAGLTIKQHLLDLEKR